MLEQLRDEVLGTLRHRRGELQVHLQARKAERFCLCYSGYSFYQESCAYPTPRITHKGWLQGAGEPFSFGRLLVLMQAAALADLGGYKKKDMKVGGACVGKGVGGGAWRGVGELCVSLCVSVGGGG